MLGAGVFVVFGPAAKFAGSLLPIAILIAALVAYLNAMSISQLAQVVTRPGGAYAYGRHYISPTAGFVAGIAFLLGKLGSVAAIALTFANYLTADYSSLVAVAAIATMTVLNILGVERTAAGARILSTITVSFLLGLLVLAAFSQTENAPPLPPEPFGVLAAAALIFFAFAGYARVATLGDEVAQSHRAIPKAIRISLAIVVVLYLALGVAMNIKLGSSLAGSETAVLDLVELVSPPLISWVWLFAAIAALGSLLALLAGMGRTAATMALDSELPQRFSTRNKFGAPWLAELGIALVGVLLVLIDSFEFLIGLSSFAVLTYYAIANLAAFRQPREETSRPKWLNLFGLASCALLALAVPIASLSSGIAVLASLLLIRWGLAKRR